MKTQSYNVNKVNLTVVSLKSLVLGMIFSTSATLISLSICGVIALPNKGIKLCVFLIIISIFHFLEFLTTSMFNNTSVDDDSFILKDIELHIVYVVSISELLITPQWLTIPLPYVGLSIAIVGQVARTLAMYTAGHSFNHYIQQNRQKSHELVTNGIYSFVRHPSYFGFFWWFVGQQIYLGNIFMLIFGIYKLYFFFRDRITYEEKFLLGFFKDYASYKTKVPSGILFLD